MIYYLTKKIYLSNYGDVAIDYASLKMLKDNNLEYTIITPENYDKYTYLSTDILLVRGGGYFGLYNEVDFKKILNKLPCKKILMPSSLYFNDLKKNNIDDIKDLNLIIFARDTQSFINYKTHFKNSNIKMCPDMVLYLNKEQRIKTGKIGVMARGTEIKIDISELNYERFYHWNKELNWNEITYEKLKNVYYDFIKIIGKYDTVITNSLHMIILSYLLNINCLAFDNKCGKVFNTIDTYLPDIIKCYDLKDINKNYKFNKLSYTFDYENLLKEIKN